MAEADLNRLHRVGQHAWFMTGVSPRGTGFGLWIQQLLGESCGSWRLLGQIASNRQQRDIKGLRREDVRGMCVHGRRGRAHPRRTGQEQDQR